MFRWLHGGKCLSPLTKELSRPLVTEAMRSTAPARARAGHTECGAPGGNATGTLHGRGAPTGQSLADTTSFNCRLKISDLMKRRDDERWQGRGETSRSRAASRRVRGAVSLAWVSSSPRARRLRRDPARPPRDTRARGREPWKQSTCARTSTAFSVTARTWQRPQRPSADERINGGRFIRRTGCRCQHKKRHATRHRRTRNTPRRQKKSNRERPRIV